MHIVRRALDARSGFAGYEGSPDRSIIPLYSPTAVNQGAISVDFIIRSARKATTATAEPAVAFDHQVGS